MASINWNPISSQNVGKTASQSAPKTEGKTGGNKFAAELLKKYSSQPQNKMTNNKTTNSTLEEQLDRSTLAEELNRFKLLMDLYNKPNAIEELKQLREDNMPDELKTVWEKIEDKMAE